MLTHACPVEDSAFGQGKLCLQGQDHSSNNTAHDLTITLPVAAPGHTPARRAAPGNEVLAGLDVASIPAPTSGGQLQPVPPGHGNSQPTAAVQASMCGPGDTGQPLLMWVRPLMQRSGDSMLFEMRPAQDLPEGCWAQSMRVNSWCDPHSCLSLIAALPVATMTHATLS